MSPDGANLLVMWLESLRQGAAALTAYPMRSALGALAIAVAVATIVIVLIIALLFMLASES